jgi:tetratricopeptide (TPR) repeat protein
MAPDVKPRLAGDRLDSWKEIASYLKRTERTVRRWEKLEGLPVHRLQHDKRGTVYAYPRELDGWFESRRLTAAGPASETSNAAGQSGSAALVSKLHWRSWSAALAAASIATIVGVGTISWTRHPANAAMPVVTRDVKYAHFGSPGRVEVLSSIKYSEEAIRLDPKYAPAWGQLGVAHIALAWFGEAPPRETMRLAQTEAREALRLNPALADGWRTLGYASHYLDWDQKAAETEFRRAIELEPRYQGALFWYSEFLLDLGRFDEALTYSRRAQEVAPRGLMPIVGTGNAYLMNGHVELAIPEYERALELDPHFGVAVHFKGLAHLAQGRHAQALEELRSANELLGGVPVTIGSLGYALGITGKRQEAEEMLADLLRKRERGYYPAFPIAQIQLGLGRTDAALDWLERAADERHVGYYFPLVDPIYDGVRTYPRFAQLMARIAPH